jgi:hypothetical protein
MVANFVTDSVSGYFGWKGIVLGRNAARNKLVCVLSDVIAPSSY